MPSTVPDDDRPVEPGELQALVEDVAHEIKTLATAAGRLLRMPRTSPDWNYVVESLLLHARNLGDFFEKDPTRDDVVAAHYVDDWTDRLANDAEATAAVTWLADADRRRWIHKRVAHITAARQRTPKEQQAPDVGEIAENTMVIARLFLRSLSPEQRRWFKAQGLVL